MFADIEVPVPITGNPKLIDKVGKAPYHINTPGSILDLNLLKLAPFELKVVQCEMPQIRKL